LRTRIAVTGSLTGRRTNPRLYSHRILSLATGVALLAAAAPALGSSSKAWAADGFSRFIVRADPGTVERVRRQVRELGGRVGRDLPIIAGFAAELPAGQEPRLRRTAGVVALSPDAAVRLTSVDSKLGYDPVTDFGSLNNVTQITGVQSAWKAGYTGKGVDVALIDSGVSDVKGLTSGNVINGPDLSFESQDPTLEHRDTYGHGTHMAGIIVGRDRAAPPEAYADPAKFVGMAPDARLLSVKVASSDGATDVSQVIAGIDWVAQHAHDNGLNVRVLNLSFGTDSMQDYRLDPLAFAAEAAWRSAGLVVVVAGGNDGTDKTVLSDPAMDPYVLAVGAEDPRNTISTADDTVPDFATRGTSNRHVDLVAPAVHVISTRDPESYIDQHFPAGRVGTRFFRGSGTSQGAAVVSGAAAVLLQRYPTLTNDQVKKMLMTSADPFSGSSSIYRGAGAINVRKALAGPIPSGGQNASAYGTGTGSLEQARGSSHVQSLGVELTAEQDIFGVGWDGPSWAPAAIGRRSWDGGSWRGSLWTGADWSGTSWTTTTWAGRSWTGADWTGQSWSGRSWVGHTWSGGGWDGRSWVDSSWAGRSWTAARWASADWS